MKVLVSFEIKFKTNRNKIIAILRHFGFNEIQDSLYFADIRHDELYAMQMHIMENIREYDSVLTMPVCKSCYGKVNIFGRSLSFKEDLYKIF